MNFVRRTEAAQEAIVIELRRGELAGWVSVLLNVVSAESSTLDLRVFNEQIRDSYINFCRTTHTNISRHGQRRNLIT